MSRTRVKNNRTGELFPKKSRKRKGHFRTHKQLGEDYNGRNNSFAPVYPKHLRNKIVNPPPPFEDE